MRQMTAKFNSKCNACNCTLKKGDVIQYNPSEKRAYCLKCKPETGENDTPDFTDALIDAYYR